VPARRSVRVAIPPATDAPSSPAWRDDVLAWAHQATRGATTERPTPPSSLQALIERGGLAEPAARIVSALYADWLDGHGDAGLACAALAEFGAPAGPGRDDAWREALGTGRLARLGLVTTEYGRARIPPSVAAYLDGRRPRAVELVGEREVPPVPAGLFRVALRPGESVRACAQRLATMLGQVALCELEASQGARAARGWLEQGRLEAWMRARVVVTAIDPGAAELRDGETVLVPAPDTASDAPGALPWWRDTRA
jgi:hypothetical protein